MDYPGNDINLDATNWKTSATTPSASECQDLCGDTKGCKVFTWSTSNQRCYLKSSKSRGSSEDGAISGPKTCKGRFIICKILFLAANWNYKSSVFKCFPLSPCHNIFLSILKPKKNKSQNS